MFGGGSAATAAAATATVLVRGATRGVKEGEGGPGWTRWALPVNVTAPLVLLLLPTWVDAVATASECDRPSGAAATADLGGRGGYCQ